MYSFPGSINLIEDVYTFLQAQKGNIQAINSVGSAIDSVANLKIQSQDASVYLNFK